MNPFPPHMMTCTFISARVNNSSQAEHRGQFPLLPTNIGSTLTSAYLTPLKPICPLSGEDHQSLPLDYRGGLQARGLCVLTLASAHHCSTPENTVVFSKCKSDHAFRVSPALGTKSNPWPTASVALDWSPGVPLSERLRGASMDLRG